SAAARFALQPLAVSPHAHDVLEQAQWSPRPDYVRQRLQPDLSPCRIWYVNREDKPPARPQDAMDLAQQGIVGVGRPALARGVRLGVLNGEAGCYAVEVSAGPSGQAGAEIALHEPDAALGVGRFGFSADSLDLPCIRCRAVQCDEFGDAAAALLP